MTDGRRLALVVDDNARVRQVVSLHLAQIGLDAVTFDDASELVEMAQAYHPAVIVLDLAMPVTDGVTAIRRLQAQPDTSHLPIVVISGYAQELGRARESARGPVVFLEKPFKPQELHTAVSRALDLASAPTS